MQSPPSSTPYGGYIPNSPYIPMLFEYKLYRAKSLSKIWSFSPAANYIPSNTTSVYKFNKKEIRSFYALLAMPSLISVRFGFKRH